MFQINWLPLFAAGAGDVELAFPDNVVQPIDANAQLVVQLHLLNTGDESITDSALINMTLSDAPSPETVMIGAFGNTDINLPAGEPSSVLVECQAPATTRVVGFFPRMHMLGTSMTLELGPTVDDMHTVYQRDPYDFDDQRIDSTDMMLEANTQVRVSCNYDNTRDQPAGGPGASAHRGDTSP